MAYNKQQLETMIAELRAKQQQFRQELDPLLKEQRQVQVAVGRAGGRSGVDPALLDRQPVISREIIRLDTAIRQIETQLDPLERMLKSVNIDIGLVKSAIAGNLRKIEFFKKRDAQQFYQKMRQMGVDPATVEFPQPSYYEQERALSKLRPRLAELTGEPAS